MNDPINIAGLDKAELLAALYNGSRPMGMGMLQARGGEMTREEAISAAGAGDDSTRMFDLDTAKWTFDYLHGRPLKINLSGDEAQTWLYNRDNGDGAFEGIVERLRGEENK